MIASVNREKLEELFVAFRTAFDLRVGFCNNKGHALIRTKVNERSALCEYLRKNPNFDHQCELSDEAACQHCDMTKQPYHFHCHVGLEEYFYPICVGKHVLGYIMTGHFFTEENREKVLNTILEQSKSYGADEATIRELFQQQRVIDMKKTEAAFQILGICVTALLKDDVFMIKDKTLSDQIDAYIQSNLDGELSTCLICDKFNISKAKLNRLSNDYFGMSLQKYVKDRRIAHSITLLNEKDMTVREIAEAVGIPDYNYFTKVFRCTTGCAPTDWRRQRDRKIPGIYNQIDLEDR